MFFTNDPELPQAVVREEVVGQHAAAEALEERLRELPHRAVAAGRIGIADVPPALGRQAGRDRLVDSDHVG